MFKFSPKLIGRLAYYVSQLLIKTFRVSYYFHPSVDQQGQYVFGIWHDKQIGPIMLMTRWGNQKHMGLVSPSKDGEMLAVWLKHLGYRVIRGSSSRKGMNSMVKLIEAAKEGYSIGITADGPRGPRYEAKSGLAFLAHKSGLKVLPMGVAYSAKWQFNRSWDKFQMPLPFSKVVLYLGEPFQIDDLNNMDEVNAIVSKRLIDADKKAKAMLYPNRSSEERSDPCPNKN